MIADSMFNLKEDSRERSNLAKEYPEKVKELVELLERYSGNASN
jgi:hypothetical protein